MIALVSIGLNDLKELLWSSTSRGFWSLPRVMQISLQDGDDSPMMPYAVSNRGAEAQKTSDDA